MLCRNALGAWGGARHSTECRGKTAMSTATNPELTPQILEELRAQLERQRRHIETEIAASRRVEGVGDTPEQDPSTELRGDMGDESVELEAWDTGHQEMLDLEAQLAAVKHALAKFDLGTYGMCETCGRPIPLARLRVIPEARYHVEHETQVEAR